jgi:hypothetical protein
MTKDVGIAIIITSVMCVPSECIAVNHLYNSLARCSILGSAYACNMKMPFTLPFDAVRVSKCNVM